MVQSVLRFSINQCQITLLSILCKEHVCNSLQTTYYHCNTLPTIYYKKYNIILTFHDRGCTESSDIFLYILTTVNITGYLLLVWVYLHTVYEPVSIQHALLHTNVVIFCVYIFV